MGSIILIAMWGLILYNNVMQYHGLQIALFLNDRELFDYLYYGNNPLFSHRYFRKDRLWKFVFGKEVHINEDVERLRKHAKVATVSVITVFLLFPLLVYILDSFNLM